MSSEEASLSGPTVTTHHFGLSVADLDAGVDWYEEKLGFGVLKRFEQPQYDLRGAFLELNGFQIELIEQRGSEPLPAAGQNPAEVLKLQGIKHTAFAVPDVGASAAELKRRGVEFAWEPLTLEELKIRFCHIKDNEGNLLEFIRNLA